MNELTKGEQMLEGLGYKKSIPTVNVYWDALFVNGDVGYIGFSISDRNYGVADLDEEIMPISLELHKAIHQILIDYGWLKEDE